MKSIPLFGVGVFLTVFAASAQADPITLYNTGVGATSLVLPPGSTDAHWQLTDVPAGTPFTVPGGAIVQTPHPAYFANAPIGSAGSSWIGPQRVADAFLPPGRYIYQLTFDLTGLDAATAEITGRMASDNSLDEVVLNGIALGITGGGFTSWLTSFTIGSGFVPGTNTLAFHIANHDARGGPTGFRAELRGSADAASAPIPEPSTLSLLALGVVGLLGRRSRHGTSRHR